ncbi:MAG: hypothetical protein OEY23_24340 [Acidimicrobiia bacterium]|nr:hypothetical protein [Acidimicrobiia bacterium]
MFFWFVGLSMALVWVVFRSPAFDYRLVAVGAVLGSAESALLGRPAVLHTLVGSVAALGGVMAATRGRRLRRRRWLGVPIGMFLHLVLDGVWADTELFWWPGFGFGFARGAGPEFARWPMVLVMEIVGVATMMWWARRWKLGEPARRERFLRSGQVGRDLAGAVEEAGC